MDLIDRDELLKEYDLAHCVKYGNKDAKQQYHSYDTLMMYEIADMIRDVPAVNRWIPCSERLPEKDTSVLIFALGHRVTAYYDAVKGAFRLTESNDLFYWKGAITHWMPLPEPPEDYRHCTNCGAKIGGDVESG